MWPQTKLEHTEMISVDARIVSNELLLRSQFWIVVPQHETNRVFSHRLFDHICKHGCYSRRLHGVWNRMMDCKIGHPRWLGPIDGCTGCKGPYHCRTCNTEFEVGGEFIEPDTGTETHVTLLYITRWLNLGSGTSPDDHIWQCHVGDANAVPRRKSFADGSIRNVFEDAGGVSLQELTRENKKRVLS